VHWDTSELEDLENNVLLTAAMQAHLQAPGVVEDQAKKFRNDWRDNARRTAGRHGKHYPSSITHEQVGGAAIYEVGPDSELPQGGMGRGFEWGSINQPPHLDMTQAIVSVPDRFEQAMGDLAERLL
jgi:hypothetical protein